MAPGTVKRSIVANINKTSTSTSRMSPSLKWGIDNEHVAHEMCKSKSGEEVADCGLIINPNPGPYLHAAQIALFIGKQIQ